MKKKILTILYLCIALAALTGCETNPFSSRMDMERLRPVQTIGLDRQGEGVVLSVSTGVGSDGTPLVMTGFSSGIETAIDRLQDYSPQDELFYAHVRYILLGETMTDDSVMPLLDWVERSPSMRMETPMLILRGSAAQAVTGASRGDSDVTERLSSLERELELRGRHIPTLRETAAALLERGGALCIAAEALPSGGMIAGDEDPASAIVPAGCAVLRRGGPAVYLTQDEALGAQLLEEGARGAHVLVGGNVLELIRTETAVSGRWEEDGTLRGVIVRCRLEAGVLERELNGETDAQVLENELSEKARGWLESVISRSQEISCDFLGLESSVLKNAPGGRGGAAQWAADFAGLPVFVLTDAEIDRSYDLSQ